MIKYIYIQVKNPSVFIHYKQINNGTFLYADSIACIDFNVCTY